MREKLLEAAHRIRLDGSLREFWVELDGCSLSERFFCTLRRLLDRLTSVVDTVPRQDE